MSSNKQLVALSPVEYLLSREKRTRWVRCGAAFVNKNQQTGEKSIRVVLDSLPVNGVLVIMPKRDRDEDQQQQRQPQGQQPQQEGGYGGQPPEAFDDDDIPY